MRRTSRGPSLLLACSLCATPTLAVEPEHTEEQASDPIIVTPSPLPRTSEELAVPVTVLDADHVKSHVGTTVGETLRNEPGITTSSFSAGSSRPVIRGQDTFRVRVLDDGLGSHDVSPISADHGVPVNPLTAERIEVVRGPATLRYGGGAIGGVVNVISNRVPRQLLETPATGEVRLGYDTGSRGRDAALLFEGSHGSFAYHLDAVTRDSDDYDVAGEGRKQRNSDTDAWSGSLGLAWIGEQGRLGFGYSKFENVYGIPIPPDELEGVSIDLDKKSWDFEADLYEPISWLPELRFRGRYSDYDHDEVEDGAALSTFDNDEWEGRLEAVHQPFGPFRGAVGLQHRDVDLRAAGEGRELLAPTQTNTLALYVYEDAQLGEDMVLQLGARIERTEVQGTPADDRRRRRGYVPLSASAGMVYNIADPLQLGLTLSATQRAPDALELFARGPHEADETFQVGDPSLDEETSFAADLLLRGTWNRLLFEASLFAYRYDDFVFGRKTGRTCDEMGACIVGPGEELDELLFTQEDATFLGSELLVRFDLGECLGGRIGLDGQLDFVRARLDRTGDVPRIPPLRWGGGVSYRNTRFQARVGFLHHEQQSDVGDFESTTSGFTMVDATATLRVHEGRTPVDLTLTGKNLLNAKARNAVSFNRDDVVLPGRTLRVGVDLGF